MKIKIKDIPNGSIVWKGYTILGIKGSTLDKKYYDKFCIKERGNFLDYSLVEKVKE
jgi:hypothetical protein